MQLLLLRRRGLLQKGSALAWLVFVEEGGGSRSKIKSVFCNGIVSDTMDCLACSKQLRPTATITFVRK
jgi:hypothetical protein